MEEIKEAERSVSNQERIIKAKEGDHRNKMQQIRQDIGQKTELGRYTREMVRLCEDIERNANKFR